MFLYCGIDGRNASTVDFADTMPFVHMFNCSSTVPATGRGAFLQIAVTFMAYGAAANKLDVSNANTPGHVDITNPVNGQGILINQRDIVELSGSGAALG